MNSQNASRPADGNRVSNVVPAIAAGAARREPRVRDFGIGYGNSSGYASNRRYAHDWAEPRFRFA